MSESSERQGFLRTFFSKDGLFARAPHKANRILTNEGPRGYSTRVAVYLRHVAYLLAILLCSAVTHYAMQAAGPFSIDGGQAMLVLVTLTLAIAAFATMGYTNQRNEIIEQARMYVFGYMVFPGTVVALVLWLVTGLVAEQANPDAFSRTVSSGLLMIFGAILIMPPVVFIRLIAGMRTMNRSTRDDEDAMRSWTRMDGFQR